MRIKKTFQGTLPENKILNTSSDSQTDTYSCDYINQEINTLTETVLFNTTESDGYSDNIPLSDSAKNYKYLEIYYGNPTAEYDRGCVKVYSPNYRRFLIPLTVAYPESMYFRYGSYFISNNTITKSNVHAFYITTAGLKYENNNTDAPRIYRVVGYK